MTFASHNSMRSALGLAMLLIAALSATAGHAAQPAPAPVGHLNVPVGAANSFGFSQLRYGPDGLLYVWDGLGVLQQNGGNFDAFGTVASAGADPGPISFSQDGSQILLSNGSGGFAGGANNGLFFTMPDTGGAATQTLGSVPYTFDALAVPASYSITSSASKYFVDYGNGSFSVGGSESFISIFDAASGVSSLVIDNIPGASAAMAFDALGQLFVANGGNGSGTSGDIHVFTPLQLETAFNTSTPLDWTAGAFFNSGSSGNNSGAGMFFDPRGYLFVGGGTGVTVFDTAGVGTTFDVGGGGYAAITYNPVANQFLASTFGADNDGDLFDAAAFSLVPEPSAIALAGCGIFVLGGYWNCSRGARRARRGVLEVMTIARKRGN